MLEFNWIPRMGSRIFQALPSRICRICRLGGPAGCGLSHLVFPTGAAEAAP
jgi:hypothetical protein